MVIVPTSLFVAGSSPIFAVPVALDDTAVPVCAEFRKALRAD
jgi:hypothetical protein